MVYYVFLSLYILVAFVLLGVILLQQGKGGGIAAAFGGSSSQTAFGARSGATVLTRATTVLGSLFLLGALGLTLMGRSTGSIVSGVPGAPASEHPAAPALPMPTVPATSGLDTPAAPPDTGAPPSDTPQP